MPPIPLVSVGNITAGGSGKTPFVIWLVRQMQAHGIKPVVLCRGDGGRTHDATLLTDTCLVADVGDEACLLFESCDCPVIVGRDRVAGSRMAADLGEVLILDDGFQYRQLQRQCDIVLVPAEGVGNGHMIPAGPLREPVTALARADLVVRTGGGPVVPLGGGRQWYWRVVGGGLRQSSGPVSPPPGRAWAVSGIARPGRFIESLQRQRIEIVGQTLFPDHYAFTAGDVGSVSAHGLPVVTTGKDAVKLLPIWPQHLPLWVLDIEGEGESGLFEAIMACLHLHER